MSTVQTPKLPPLSALSDAGQLSVALSTLFEPSPALLNKLVPAVHAHISEADSYESLIDLSLGIISAWPTDARASFIGGHPRIGEVTGLSALSAGEQARLATPADVLEKLARLNALYERRYPGLRYITFVNGRSRTETAREMQDKLHGVDGDGEVAAVGDDEWERELDRAVGDVGKIAKSRLKVLL